MLQALREKNVVHFDIKGDNVLLEALPGVSEHEFWAPSSSRLPFRVVFADFGESTVFADINAGTTLRWAHSLPGREQRQHNCNLKHRHIVEIGILLETLNFVAALNHVDHAHGEGILIWDILPA